MLIRKAENVILWDNYISKLLDINRVDVIINYDIAHYFGAYPDLFPMTNFHMSLNKTTKDNLEGQTTISVRWLKNHETKRRYENTFDVIHWYIAVVFYNEVPILVLRSPDVRNDGYTKMLVVDELNHKRANGFIFQYVESDPGPELEMWGLDAPSGSYGGDVQPHVRAQNYNQFNTFNLPEDKRKLEYILNYTIDPHFNWEEVGL